MPATFSLGGIGKKPTKIGFEPMAEDCKAHVNTFKNLFHGVNIWELY
ncbi:MAG: hypothetical protein JNK61_09555 [Bacteroidia bacterium]|jgi:hypothetical protein|nr:hypothetical protein [Bacteroidia bacterium]